MHPLDIFYLACLMLGGVYCLFTLLMGGLSHAAGHAGHIGHTLHLPGFGGDAHVGDAAGHVGHVGGGHSAHGHAADAGHVGHGHAAHGHGHAHSGDAVQGRGSPGHSFEVHAEHHALDSDGGFSIFQYLNPISVAGFLLGFGGTGFLTRMFGMKISTSLLFAGAGGWGLWLFAYLVITRVFGAAGGTSHNRQEEVIGLRASVTAPIAGSQPGSVSYIVAGTRQSLRAITDDDEAIPVGATVRIRKIESSTAHVMRIDGS